jgi:hypothetical protein
MRAYPSTFSVEIVLRTLVNKVEISENEKDVRNSF